MRIHREMLTISSNPKSITLVENFVENIASKYNIHKDVYGNILISLTEAVNNAILHGNNADETKKVLIKLKTLGNKLAFLVSDEGQGFDYQSLPDPTSPQNLLKVGGRGVFLMRQLSDNVVFTDNGSTVEIHFNISKHVS
jgi:serine/threonine-protein kinase RsbW